MWIQSRILSKILADLNKGKSDGIPVNIPLTRVQKKSFCLTRREFVICSAGTFGCVCLGTLITGCGSGGSQITQWPISQQVLTTAQRTICPVAIPSGAPLLNPDQISLYAQYGYTAWQAGSALPCTVRTDLAPHSSGAPDHAAQLLSFFAMTDVHIADKESPAQPLYVGWGAPYGQGELAAYSPILTATTHVLDAAIQTINALHENSPFDFGIALGDAANNTQYNELRWYIDVIDGKIITPSSGANLGADTVDYQKPYQAAGLNRSIPWYQVIGNHDQSWMGSACEDAQTLAAHTSNTVMNMGLNTNAETALSETGFYMGVINGADPLGAVILSGPQQNFSIPPTVAADQSRHSLATLMSPSLNWMTEFFTTTSTPAGHGFTQYNLDNDLACYSFLPKSNIPIKVIVLDDTVKGPNHPEYALASLDQTRLDWLKYELDAGQANNQLMIIAAHIPVAPCIYPGLNNTAAGHFPFFNPPGYVDPTCVVTDATLLSTLQTYPNLMMWIAGHRHVNTVTLQAAPSGDPTLGFWEVETASLKDFPRHFRTFNVYRNSDNTISIVITNVDPAVASGSPAATSLGNAIATARIVGMPTAANLNTGGISPTDTNSYAVNAELVVQLTPIMQAVIANL